MAISGEVVDSTDSTSSQEGVDSILPLSKTTSGEVGNLVDRTTISPDDADTYTVSSTKTTGGEVVNLVDSTTISPDGADNDTVSSTKAKYTVYLRRFKN